MAAHIQRPLMRVFRQSLAKGPQLASVIVPRFRPMHSAARPLLNTSKRPLPAPRSQPLLQQRTIFIQTEDTPNIDALKFVPNAQVLPATFPTTFVEYLSPRSTISPPHPSPLAAQLLQVDGVSSVFYGSDYITVTKESGREWAHIKPEVFALITEAVVSGQPMVTSTGDQVDSLAYDESDSEVVQMIKELLETRVRPAIQEDGGDIEFRGFDEETGVVKLKLRGACRTCDSSTVTLKNGIESMVQFYVQEVTAVEQVLDEEEEVALREFQKFEEKLRKQKGESATAEAAIDRAA